MQAYRLHTDVPEVHSALRLPEDDVIFCSKVPEINGQLYQARCLPITEYRQYIQSQHGRYMRIERDGVVSQSELARRIGVSQGWLSTVERNLTELRFSTAAELHKALGGRALYLLFTDRPSDDTRPDFAPAHAIGSESFPFVVGRYFADQREQLTLSQRETAELLGQKQTVIAEFERGYAEPRLSSIARRFGALDMNVELCIVDDYHKGVASPSHY